MDKATILIVEDEALVATDIKEMLELLGYKVVAIADNGPDAIRIALDAKPSIILMDIVIKGPYDGIETAEKILSEIDVPIIYVTAYADETKLQRAKITEPFGYIIKPFEEKILRSTIEMAIYKSRSEKEKKELREQVIRLSRKIPLTDNEKKVYSGLIQFPYATDIELARILKIKRSTVTAIRGKLTKEEYFTTFRVPNFAAIGCELLAVTYGKLSDIHSNWADVLKEISAVPEQVFLLATSKEVAGLCISESFYSCKTHLDSLTSLLKREGLAESLTNVYFSLNRLNYRRFLDCSSYVNMRLGTRLPDIEQDMPMPKPRKLTQNEKNILYALVKYASFTDSEISNVTKLPRPSISQARRKMTGEGLILTINLPNLIKLRSELLVLSHVSYNAGIDDRKLAALSEFYEKRPSSIFHILGNIELCSLDIYEDYSEYEHAKTELNRFSAENNHDGMASSIYTVPNIDLFSLNFAPLVKKVLGIKAEY